jgi:L-cysteine/cystine lyase
VPFRSDVSLAMPDLAPSLGDLETHRLHFPALNHKLYFNYGGQGPLPQSALDAIVESYTQIQQDGPFSKKALTGVMTQIAQTHSAIAQELGVGPETITLTDSVSTGCNIALWGLPWRKGDRLLLTDCEHPGIVAAAQALGQRFEVEIDSCALEATLNKGDPVAAIAEQVKANTRLVVLSHILWNTGQVLPLAAVVEACRRQNPSVLVLVDAAQSVGVLPLSLAELGVDFYAFTGHKWLCGPDGVGALYVRPALQEVLQPTFIGWRGIRVDAMGNPIGWKNDGTKFEMATAAFPLYRGLSEAIAIHQRWGNSAQRYQRICQLSERLWSNLNQIHGVQCLRHRAPEAGLVSFQIKDAQIKNAQLENGSHAEWVTQLENQQIMLRLIVSPNCLRVCVHYLTLESEVDEFANRLAAMLSKAS